MAGGLGDIEPIGEIEGSDAVTPHQPTREEGGGGRRRVAIRGEIVAVTQRNVHRDAEAHLLDVSVGAEEHTEITVRVPPRAYGNLEGRRVVMYLEEP